MFALLPFVVFLSVLSASSAKHQPPEFQASEMHKADCNKYESFVVDVAFERTKEGTVIVVGAHNHDNDLWNHLANAKTLNKIFVEPLIPSLFHKFEEDAKSLTNVKVIDAAVTGTDSTNTTIYCTGSAHPGHVVFIDGQDAKHSPIAENIVQTCSLDKERLFLIHDLDVGGDIYTAKKNVLKHMTTHQVDTLSLQSLMDRHVTDRVVMLQIDVEGVDDQVQCCMAAGAACE